MSFTRRFLDRVQPLFNAGGRYEKYYPLYEMLDTFLYTPSRVAQAAPHIRDGNDLKRIMIFVVLASLPAVVVGIYNVGYQANLAMQHLHITDIAGWRGWVLSQLGVAYDAQNALACFVHGLTYFLPIYIVTLVVGGFWEVLFSIIRKHDINEGFLVTSWLFVATLPASIPLWQVALGISFGIVIGKEVFGGTGKNFLNPALVGRAFLFFAYPVDMSGNEVWVTVDAYSGATPLAMVAAGGVEALTQAGITWGDAFLGTIQGSLGETSAAACLLGALFLVFTGVASARIMLGVLVGVILTSLIFNLLGGDSVTVNENMAYGMAHQTPWYWHLVLGGCAFGLVFMATDPVSAAMTNLGKWVFGLFIGVVAILIRVANPAYAEGMMLAILLGNVFAPLIDYVVIRAHIYKRRRRYEQAE